MPRALFSVRDKTGLLDFARSLAGLGWELVASGGTAAALKAGGLEAIEVSELTGFPELLGGRVKTLHPAIHGPILARSSENDLAEIASRGWKPLDLVVVDLYPFERAAADFDARAVGAERGTAGTGPAAAARREGSQAAPSEAPDPAMREAVPMPAELVEEIDIGGVALLRAAAKNHERVAVICDIGDYASVAAEIASGSLGTEGRRRLAAKAFLRTSSYDAAIAARMGAAGASALLDRPDAMPLRYGENPHQKAVFIPGSPGAAPLGGRILGGKGLSYNNILDLEAAFRAATDFEEPAAVIVKHLSPCGIALGATPAEAFAAALASDPVSAFGGIAAFNRVLDESAARELCALFLECVAAPGFEPEALALLSAKKNLRLVEADPELYRGPREELRSAAGGILAQETDRGDPPGLAWRQAGSRAPSEEELRDLRFAWKAAAHVRSNAIVLAKGGRTVGIGGGQTNRVDAVRQAVSRAGEAARGAVMASDAFFPFPDGILEAAKAGVGAVVYPSGSIRDAEVLAAAESAGLAVMLAGARHFRH